MHIPLLKTGAALAAVLLCAAASPSDAAARIYKMKLGWAGPSTGSAAYLAEFKRRIEIKTINTENKIEASVDFRGTASGLSDMLAGTASASRELTLLPSAYLAGLFPAYAPALAPGLFHSKRHADRALHTEAVSTLFRELGEPKGIIPIGLYVNGPVTLFSSKRIRTVADMKGLKIRTMPSTIESLIVPTLYATAIPDPFGDTSPPDKNTVLDGAATQFGAALKYTWYKVAPIAVTSDVSYAFTLAIVPAEWFNALPPALQKEVIVTGAEMNQWTTEMSSQWQRVAERSWNAFGGKFFPLPTPSDDTLRRMSDSYIDGLKKLSNDEDTISRVYRTIINAAGPTGD